MKLYGMLPVKIFYENKSQAAKILEIEIGTSCRKSNGEFACRNSKYKSMIKNKFQSGSCILGGGLSHDRHIPVKCRISPFRCKKLHPTEIKRDLTLYESF
jgi:hypothetical protein